MSSSFIKSKEEIQDQELFDKSILNAPKQKFKIPKAFPSPFFLEDSEDFEIKEDQKEYKKNKNELIQNDENFSLSSLEDEEESSNDEEFLEFIDISKNKKESFDEEKGKIFFSLLKNSINSTDSKDDTEISSSQKNVEELIY